MGKPLTYICWNPSQSANGLNRLRCTLKAFLLVKIMSKKADITGIKYGKLTAIHKIDGHIWMFQCDCGLKEPRNRRHVAISFIRGGTPRCHSCFNIIRSESGKNNKTHGLSKYKLYDVHRQMMRRCYDQSCKDYKNYGARFISVCHDWHFIGSFVEWALSSGYQDGLTIERIDVNGNYCPENCKWIKNEYQALNTRKITKLTAFCKTMSIREWSIETGINLRTIKGRIARGWSAESAVSTPV